MTLMTGIDDGAVGCAGGITSGAADKHAGHSLDGALGRRQPNTHGPVAADVFESFQ